MKKSPNILAFFVGIFLSIPMIFLLVSWLLPADDAIAYFVKHGLIWTFVINSTIITVACGFFSLVIGTATAWAVTMWNFPGRKLLSWMLILPFAIPAYVAAMVYGFLLESAGPVQTLLRDTTGLSFGEYYFPDIRSMGGVIFILTITLYPYVYLAARTAFLTQSRQMHQTAEILGLTRSGLIYKVVLPLARPMLIAGVALVMMEALADFGVVSLFGVQSFTTGIYRIWQDFYDPIAASRIACLMFLLVLALLWLERYGRGNARYDNPTGLYHPFVKIELSGYKRWVVSLLCALPVLLGFIIPTAYIMQLSLFHLSVFTDESTLLAMYNSVTTGLMVASIATIIGLCFAYILRKNDSKLVAFSLRLATSGYAIPGSIIAVGVLLFLVTLQNDVFDGNIFLTGSIIGVIWGCTIRFLTISFNGSESALSGITTNMDAAAQTLGLNKFQILFRLHLPILQASLIASFMLIFIDTLKELPATLLLRPFDFNTLAIRSYELAKDDLLSAAAPNAFILILISLVSVWLLNRKLNRSRPGVVHE